METIRNKFCPRCREFKLATTEYFGPVRNRPDGLDAYCRPCSRTKGREQKRKSRAANPGKNAEACRRYALANPDKKRARYQKWYEKNTQKAREYARSKIAANPKAHRERVRKWRQDNPEIRRETARRSYDKRRARAEVRINDAIRGGITKSLCERAVSKGGRRTSQILGYTSEELKAHLERQFGKGMGWHNYGEWHIDHIVPLREFKFSSLDDPEFKAAWALANLRPMWGLKNMSKGGKRMTLL